jgi:tetratricopeptide (TPR) repeat protein
MLRGSTERARRRRCSRLCSRLKLTVLLILEGTLFLLARSPASQAPSSLHSGGLPKSCVERSHAPEKVSALLESIHDHPMAGAYNTLGVLYAQADRVACAIAAFDSALKLDDRNWEAHYNLALALLRKGDREQAVRELQTAIRQKPDSVSSHFALGSVFEGEKRLGNAEEQFRSALKIDPQFAPGAIKLSEVLIIEGKPQAAIACLEDAVKGAPPDQAEPVQAALGIAYATNGEMEKGVATLNDLVAAQPDSADAHFSLGLVYAKPGQPKDEEAAVKQFREALRLDQGLDPARIALGRVLISMQKYSDAAPVVLEYTRRQPLDSQGFHALGQTYQGLRKSDAAIGAFQHAVRLNPTDAAIRFDLGMLLADTTQTGAAIEQLEAAERIHPSDPATHSELALLFEKVGDKEHANLEQAKVNALTFSGEKEAAIAKLYDEAGKYLSAGNAKQAAETYRKTLQLDPRDAKLRYNLSLALDRLGDFSLERKELEKAVELDPGLAPAQDQLGLLALRSGQQGEAEKLFKKALTIDPTFAEAQCNLGVLYNQNGKNAVAEQLFRQAIENDPNYAKAYVNLGLLMAQKGAFPEAQQQFRTAIQIDSSYSEAFAALGMLQAKTGRGAEAVQSFRKVITLAPASAQAHLNLGIALVDQFDRPDGFEEFSEAARLDPKLPGAHYNLGRFFFETGKYQDADRELETANRLQPDYAGALYFLALSAKQEGQLERSNLLLRKVVALQADNADAQYLLGQSLAHSGDSLGAIEHWKAAVQADPTHSQALYNLAKSLNKIHDPEAKQYQNRFDALQRSQQITDRVSELGNFALEAANAQNWPQAVEQMNEAIQLCGKCSQSAHLHKNLGLFYGRTGNIGEAKKELQAALQLAPNDSDAQNALTMLEHAHGGQVK